MTTMKATAILAAAMVLTAMGAPAGAERVKDIVDVKGIRSNPLWGYGLVIGLNGTGDGSTLSKRALANVLRRAGLTLTADEVDSKNVASVIVTAELPPFARKGTSVDVTVSCIGPASSLQGGTLLLTALTGADGQAYAVSQGAVTVGGFSAEGEKSSVQKNHTTVGRVPNGATVEKEEIATFVENGEITLQLRNPDFATAEKMAKAINADQPDSAHAADSGAVRVVVPKDLKKTEITAFLDKITQLDVPVDFPALVVINERTGTIVVGKNVGISTVAISHGNLSIITEEKEFVSQPPPLSTTGTTERVGRTEIRAIEEKGVLRVVPKQVSVSELARALNAMGLTPRDLIAIFEALKKAGALQAELKIM
jgi:flagellar P-ring protein precursor FlgI